MDWLLAILVWLCTTSALPLAMAAANTCLTCCTACSTWCDETSAQIRVTISGLVDSASPNNPITAGCCASSMDGVYILNRSAISNCAWGLNLSPPKCPYPPPADPFNPNKGAYTTLNATIDPTTGIFLLELRNNATAVISWRTAAAVPTPCTSWSFSPPLFSNVPGACDGTSATALVESV